MVEFNEAGSSRDAAPVVKREAAPAPRPTPAPLRRAHGEAARLRMRAETFDEAMEERAAIGDVIVGPFEARNAAEAEKLRRALLSDKEAVRKLQQRQADLESPLRPRARALAKEALAAVEAALERRDYQAQMAELERRQSQDEQRCFVGNDRLSCYPTNGLQVVQGQWSKFIWNTNYPEFTNNGGYVDVYLFHQDSDVIATSWTSLPNAQGRLSFSPNDPYWENRAAAANFSGQNITWPFYFVVTSSGFGLGGETTRLSTWTAVQTALPRAIAESRSAASASAAAQSLSLALANMTSTATLTGAAASAASSAAAAAASSSVAASFTSALVSSLTASGLTGTETTRGVLTTTLSNGQIVTASATVRANGIPIAPQSNDSGLPKYAIALIAVFGFLALVAAIAGLYFLMAAARRKRRQQASHAGSDSPMMRGIDGGASVAGTDAYSDAGAAAALRRSTAGEESSPFSTDEATRMADAFRAALRKPAFDETAMLNGSPEEGESPGEQDTGRALLREELKAEGREVHNVGERKTPTIH